MSEKETMEYNQQRDLKQKEIDKIFVRYTTNIKKMTLLWVSYHNMVTCSMIVVLQHKGDDGFVFYKGVDIAEAINNSLMNDTTFTSYPFLKRFLNTIQIFWQDKKILA